MIDSLLTLIVLTNLAMLGLSRLNTCIRVAAVQGLLLGALTLVVGRGPDMIALAVVGAGLKAIVFPWLLFRALREAEVNREMEPFVGFTMSVLFGLLGLAGSLWLGWRLPLPALGDVRFEVSIALFTMLTGFFLIVARKKAVTQVLGYLILENGIYALGLHLAPHEPLWVGIGVLLDVFVAVFVMGIMVFHINREFDHIDADQRSTLRDWTQRWKRPS
jgi:hydrogenase-4 component E